MDSRIATAVRLTHHPVALVWSDEKPVQAMEFQEGKWGCVMWLVSAAAKGKTAVCGRSSFGCFGGGVGMGFGNQYTRFPGGEECFCYFLSIGNEAWEGGRQAAKQVKPFMRKEAHAHFVHGERYLKTPDGVRDFIQSLPIRDIPAEYVVFKPLKDVDERTDQIRSVVFFADPDQLSALVVLANYSRPGNENVIIPYAAGCQTIGIYPYQEGEAETPRAVVGLTDLSARAYIKKQLGAGLLSFTVPLAMFREMEANVEGSFLQGSVWQSLVEGK